MSNHDLTIANGPGINVRQDIEAALQALGTNFQGPAVPLVTYPCQIWADSGTGLLKLRNIANTAWITLGPLDTAAMGMLPLTGGTLAGPGNLTVGGTLGVTGLATLSGGVIAGSGTGLVIDVAAGIGKQILGRTSGSSRWLLQLGNATAEGGSNSGSDFALYRYSDAAVFIDAALTINRANGIATFIHPVNVAGLTSSAQVNVTGASGAQALIAYTATRSWLAGQQTDGTFIIYDATAPRTDLVIDTAGNATWAATVIATGYRTRAGLAGAYGSSSFNLEQRAGVHIWLDTTDMGLVTLTSDYRVKKDIAPLPSMWERVKSLRPISYQHQDYTPPHLEAKEDGSLPEPLILEDGVERWGFVAHELQETLIQDAATGVKDQANCIQSPNVMTIVATLTRALQEAMERIERLEAQIAAPA
jgi:Chaperone of endosialidase